MNEVDGFGAVLRGYRIAAGLTQEELAERAGLSVRGLSDLERGLHQAPQAFTQRRLVEALGLDPVSRLTLRAAARKRGATAPGSTANGWARPLPQPLSSFVGRQAELVELREHLTSERLLTLTGTGGVGKTRLALRLAQDVFGDYPDGVVLVELAPVADGVLVTQAVAQGLGAPEQRGRPLLDALADILGQRHVLLVLDNCEHLAEACAHLAEHLLGSCPHVHILATSREPLGVASEIAWRVPGLSESEAVELFDTRAQSAESSFGRSPRNDPAVAEICRQLDGLPLAIELAAARARMLAPAELLARLGDRFSILVGGARTAPPRHKTLRAAVDWSYGSLGEQERLLFDRLSVFVGSFSLDAAEAVCRPGVDDVFNALARLVDRSLVLAEWPADVPETRYRLLQTLRAYGWERLHTDPSAADLVERRHAVWTLELAERAERAFHGPDEEAWLLRLEYERDNVRAALAWATTHNEPETALRLVGALGWFDGLRGPWSEGRMWVERALTMPGAAAPTAARGYALIHAAKLAVFQADFAVARTWIDEAIGLGQQLAREDVALEAHGVTTLLLQFTGAAQDAERLADEVLVVARRLGQSWWAGRMLCIQASGAQRLGDNATAAARLEEAIQLARLTGDRWSQAMALSQFGDVERARQAYARAGQLYAASLALRTSAAPGGTGEASLRHNLGYVALANGDVADAGAHFHQALDLFDHLGERRGVAEALVGLAAVAAADGRTEAAARLFGTGDAVLNAAGSRVWQSNRADYEHWVALTRAGLIADVFESAWSLGRQTPLDEAIAFARAN